MDRKSYGKNEPNTQEKLKELFEYKNAEFYWKIKPSSKIKKGSRAGRINAHGYRQIGINRKQYQEHRLVWLYHYGYLPKEIDHINGIKDDNRLENLRKVTRSQNQMNSKKAKNRSSKFKGVTWCKENKKWRSRIMKNRKHYHLGHFNTEKEAGLSYNKKAVELFGEFAKLNEVF